MNAQDLDFRGRLTEVRGRIAAAAARSGRIPKAVTLIGVVKTIPVDRIREAIASGLEDVGENRVQDAERERVALGSDRARWHMIGHLQQNKSHRALELFDRIHTLDSVELARRMSRQAVETNRRIAALVQVNVSGETTKSGVAPEVLVPMLEQVLPLPGLRVDGLMSIGTPAERPDESRREFVRLRELRDAAERAVGARLPELSMGMSGDYEVAVEEGSTLVRVGTALFGARP